MPKPTRYKYSVANRRGEPLTVTADYSLTEADIMKSGNLFIKITAIAQLTLPVASDNLRGASIYVTTTDQANIYTAAGFGGGITTTDTVQLGAYETAEFWCNGTYWYALNATVAAAGSSSSSSSSSSFSSSSSSSSSSSFSSSSSSSSSSSFSSSSSSSSFSSSSSSSSSSSFSSSSSSSSFSSSSSSSSFSSSSSSSSESSSSSSSSSESSSSSSSSESSSSSSSSSNSSSSSSSSSFTGEGWLGLGAESLYSVCEDDGSSTTIEAALNGTNVWKHTANETHFFIIDLGATRNVQQVRGRSGGDASCDPTNVNIYVGDNPADFGAAIYSGITNWQDTTIWQEIDIANTNGRYVKVEITTTESGIKTLEFGGPATGYFKIFDVYVAAAV